MYDVAIIGAGPAGLAAGLYTTRGKLSTVILEGEAIGGQIATTAHIENYPGSDPEVHESGVSLTTRMKDQAVKFGCEIVRKEVVEVDLVSNPKKLKLSDDSVIEATGVIIATGAVPRKLGVPGEKQFAGKGVSYCSTCDGDIFTDLEILVVGGGNTAVEEAIYLTDYGSKVTLLVRRDEMRADAIIQERAINHDKLNIKYNTSIKEIRGDKMVSSLVLVNNETGEEYEYHANEDDGVFGVFIFVGTDPQSEVFKDQVELDEYGYILTDKNMKTNIDLVYAAGDVRDTVLRQVVTAASDGSIAAVNIDKDIKALR